MIILDCPRCGGDRGEYICDGDDPLAWHSCYHCCETGVLEYTEQEYVDMVNELLDEAAAASHRIKKAKR